ncbi:MAG: aldehyde dehydrogenase, partial [Candidatus Puniceispirillaceae bacterium]
MSELLTHEEYKAIADGLTLASTAFVDGGFRKAANGETFDSIDPATGKLLAKVAACDAADVDFAVGKARE